MTEQKTAQSAPTAHATSPAEWVHIDDLKPNPRNPRKHGQEVLRLAKTILRTTWGAPILAQRATRRIIGGHGRLEAAREILAGIEVDGELRGGHEHVFAHGAPGPGYVPVRWLDVSDAEADAMTLADNARGLQGEDDAVLIAEMAAQFGRESELMRDIGYSTEALDRMIAGAGDAIIAAGERGESDDDSGDGDDEDGSAVAEALDRAAELQAKWGTAQGQLWLIDDASGVHRIVCGDSASAADVARATCGTPHVLLTDPPYGIGYGYNEHDDSDNDANADLVAKVFALAPPAKVWSPGGNNLARDIVRFGKAKVLYWHKRFAAAGNGLGGASTVEPVLVVGPPKHRALANDYLDFKTDRVEVAGKSLRELHPCPKPAALYAHLAEAFCAKGGAIYEPFSGSGTTLIAAEMTGRRCFAIELSPAYVDVAVRRWEDFTGRVATLEATGQTFREVADERRLAALEAA